MKRFRAELSSLTARTKLLPMRYRNVLAVLLFGLGFIVSSPAERAFAELQQATFVVG